jgi:hypothetical protein
MIQTIDTTVSGSSAGMALEVINGNPAIAYFDGSGADLFYVRANDVNGDSWGTIETVSSTDDVGRDCSLKEVDGQPAIAYKDETNNELDFARYNGSSWDITTVDDDSNDVGGKCSLAIISGNPAISYSDQTAGSVLYVRATNSTGSSWGTIETVDTTYLTTSGKTSLTTVSGQPGIAFGSDDTNRLKFARYNGSSWDVTTASEDTGQRCILIVANGNPAILYNSSVSTARYVRATNSTGSAWDTEVTVETSVLWLTGDCISGKPAGSYYDFGADILYYHSSYDANGDDW